MRRNLMLAAAVTTAAYAICDAIASRRMAEIWRMAAVTAASRVEPGARCQTAIVSCVRTMPQPLAVEGFR